MGGFDRLRGGSGDDALSGSAGPDAWRADQATIASRAPRTAIGCRAAAAGTSSCSSPRREPTWRADFRHASNLLDLSALGFSWSDFETSRQGRDLHVAFGGVVEIVLIGLGSHGLERSHVIL
jgi:hypothetical protein